MKDLRSLPYSVRYQRHLDRIAFIKSNLTLNNDELMAKIREVGLYSPKTVKVDILGFIRQCREGYY